MTDTIWITCVHRALLCCGCDRVSGRRAGGTDLAMYGFLSYYFSFKPSSFPSYADEDTNIVVSFYCLFFFFVFLMIKFFDLVFFLVLCWFEYRGLPMTDTILCLWDKLFNGADVCRSADEAKQYIQDSGHGLLVATPISIREESNDQILL